VNIKEVILNFLNKFKFDDGRYVYKKLKGGSPEDRINYFLDNNKMMTPEQYDKMIEDSDCGYWVHFRA
jgi:hypothetical protein